MNIQSNQLLLRLLKDSVLDFSLPELDPVPSLVQGPLQPLFFVNGVNFGDKPPESRELGSSVFIYPPEPQNYEELPHDPKNEGEKYEV